MLDFKNWKHYLQDNKHIVRVITNYNNFRYFMTTKKLNVKQIRWAKKLAAFDFIIEYRKNTFNFANASSRKSDIIKSKSTKDSNKTFFFILRNKLRNREYQSKILMNFKISVAVKLTTSTTQLNSMFIANTSVIDWNEKMLVKRHDVLKVATFRFLIHQIMKSKKSYLKLRKSIIAWLLKFQQKNVFVAKQKWRQKYAINEKLFSQWNISENELLRKNLAVYVSKNSITKKKIFRINHDNSSAEHFAKFRIMTIIRKKYYWNNIKNNIEKYCKFCSVCQKMRVYHYKLYNNLFFIASNSVESFTIVIFDFIIDMSFARNLYTRKTYNSILILVDKLIKHVIYIACNKILNAKSFVDLL